MTQVSYRGGRHQLNVKTLQTIQISDTEYGATSCQRRTEHETTTRNIRFPNQMIEQINIALEQKGSGISQPESLKPPSEITSEKRAYTSIKSDEE